MIVKTEDRTKGSYCLRLQGRRGIRTGAERGMAILPMSLTRWAAAIVVLRMACPIALIFAWVVAFAHPCWADSASKLKILIRYDDFSRTSNSAVESKTPEARNL